MMFFFPGGDVDDIFLFPGDDVGRYTGFLKVK